MAPPSENYSKKQKKQKKEEREKVGKGRRKKKNGEMEGEFGKWGERFGRCLRRGGGS